MRRGVSKKFVQWETADLVARLQQDFPGIVFIYGARFKFRPPNTVVVMNTGKLELLLHEVGHVLTRRFDFRTEVERLRIEVAAWEKARELGSKYKITLSEELIQDELDSYREWLHQKSRCPNCGLTRFQTPDGNWHCPNELFS